MKNLNVMENEIKLSSREVAQMMNENKHSNLIRKIELIDKVLLSSKMSSVNYWLESFYIDSTGRSVKEYLVTKQGCELLAHKSTGEKGILFTVKYMERFKQMEQQLKTSVDSYMISDPIERAAKWIEEQKEKVLFKKNLEAQKLLINEYKPKADFVDDLIIKSKSLFTVNQIASDFGISAIKLNKILKELKVQYKQGEHWFLSSKYRGLGLAQEVFIKTIMHRNGEVDTIFQTKWTLAGRKFIYDLLKDLGYHLEACEEMKQLSF